MRLNTDCSTQCNSHLHLSAQILTRTFCFYIFKSIKPLLPSGWSCKMKCEICSHKRVESSFVCPHTAHNFVYLFQLFEAKFPEASYFMCQHFVQLSFALPFCAGLFLLDLKASFLTSQTIHIVFNHLEQSRSFPSVQQLTPAGYRACLS